MIKYTPANQLTIEGFYSPFENKLSKDNRWVLLASVLPWDSLANESWSEKHRYPNGNRSSNCKT